MRILHLIYSFTTGGAETMLVDIANRQCKSNQVGLIVINNKYDTDLIDKLDMNIPVFLLHRKEGSRNPIKILHLNILIRRYKPDVIHCHNEGIIKLLFMCMIPVCRTIHSTGPLSINKISEKYNKLISISQSVDDDLIKRTGLRSIVVNNGIVFDAVRQKSFKKADGIFRIVQVSRIEFFHKGQDILIEAIHVLLEKGLDHVHVDFIGEGNSMENLKELVEKYHISDSISILGNKTREYIYSHLCDYDLFVQPSRFEGFGLTVVEAMAAKIPVLVSDIEGPMEIIDNGKYGFYFKNKDPEDCAAKIEKIINGDMKTDVATNYEYAKANYDISNTVNGYQKVYKQMIRK